LNKVFSSLKKKMKNGYIVVTSISLMN